MGGAAVAETRIRSAVADDAQAIARIQIAAWRTAYRQILPPRFLDALDLEQRADRWRGRLAEAAQPDAPTFVAVDTADAVLGFAHTGPSRDEDFPSERVAELYTLYVDPAAWRRGIGSALSEAVLEFWRPSRIEALTLWVFEMNAQARAFYEARGWTADGARQVDDFGDAAPVEVRYRQRVRRSRAPSPEMHQK